MKIVITGGLGFIGSNIIQKLNGEHELIILDNYSTSIISKINGINAIECDITKSANLNKIKISNVDVVLHLAAQSSGPKSIDIPDVDININIMGTLNIINWCISNSVPKIIFASSFVVYGDNKNECVGETDYCYPRSIYALSKMYCERLLEIYGTHHGLNWNIIRHFNVYGPGQDLSRMDQGMISIFMKLMMDQNHIKVKGSLSRFRDFIHIDDVVEAWILCLNDSKYSNQIYNLGTGVKTTINELLNALSIILNKKDKIKIEQGENTPGDILGCYANIDKMREQINFKPKYELLNGLKNMANCANNYIS